MAWATVLLAAVAGSFHCAGMCGGFVLAAMGSRTSPRRRSVLSWLIRQLPYHLGRATSYAMLGAIAGLGAESLAAAGASWKGVLAVACSAMLLFSGLREFGLLSNVRLTRLASGVSAISRVWGTMGRSVSRLPMSFRPLLLGAFSGLLPCPLVYGFLAAGASTGSILHAVAIMLALALGTLPMLALVAGTGHLLSPVVRRRAAGLVGSLLIFLAFYTLWRTWVPLDCHVSAGF